MIVQISIHRGSLPYCADIDTSAYPPHPSWTVRSGSDLGRALAGIRRAQGLTQAELAERTGLNRSYIARIERGHSVEMLERTLTALRRMGAEVTVRLPPDDA